jgi:hypothetical protein
LATLGNTHDSEVHLEEDRTHSTADIMATHATVKHMIKKWKDSGISYIWTIIFLFSRIQ